MGLHLRRRLSAAPRYGSPRRPSRQHRSHVIASGRDRSSGRSRQPRRSVLDGAGYHVAKDLAVPHNITLVPLPHYAPELTPIENVWDVLLYTSYAADE